MSVDPTPAPAPASADTTPSITWAHELEETPPSVLRARRRKRITVMAGAAVVAVAAVAGLVYSVTDHRRDVVVAEGFAPHDKVKP
ncbi:hypothetical protein [Couchioplanes caeruleus]|uniref:hypothetical protein n=1 Tax=Couchioplanes caeruleus TaxID=56438 RepID=UPI001160A080|nr:hypothetical protein [Couchioplanes caeruleus]